MSINIDIPLLILLGMVVAYALYDFIKKRSSFKRTIVIFLFAAYVYFSFRPIINTITINEFVGESNIVESTNLSNLENVKLFVMMGFFVTLLNSRKRVLKSVLKINLIISIVFALIFATGLIYGKTPTINMIIFNMVGAIIGYILCKIFIFIMHKMHINTNLDDGSFLITKSN